MGFHLAKLLARENQDIILIDNNQEILDYAATHLDVLTLNGDSASIETLNQADISKAKLVICVTTSEKNNLVTAMLAKKLGAKYSVARVENAEYLIEDQKQLFRELGIDSLISPNLLAAEEIKRLLKQCTFTDVFEFEEGKISLVGITLNEKSSILDRKVSELYKDGNVRKYRPLALLRRNKTIIPDGSTKLYPDDHVYFVTPNKNIACLEEFVGQEKITIKNVMIAGGTPIAKETASILEQEFNVTLVEANKDRCKQLAEELPRTLIINGEPSNMDLLKEEGLARMDAFIALTPNSETNIITSLSAKHTGVYKTIAQVENREYTHISQEIGVDTLINKKLIAANNIFRHVRKGKIEAITSLHGVDAEVIEFEVHKENQLTKKELRDVHFPDAARIGGVIRAEETIIPSGDFKLKKGDKVIVLALPKAINKLERLFR